jgi:riboflavin synthase
VDGVAAVTEIRPQTGGQLASFAIPVHLTKYVISEGSIAIDGVSLTVARLHQNNVTVSLIPHTLQKTTLSELQAGSQVNVEVDLIGKYIAKLMNSADSEKISEAWLQKMGLE